ncbi:hypothetical protein [Vibrio mytili]|uniref:Uncharacterized protein n=1 Tax=Vibrio mytili TaxID=50718 RepID=A0A0C3DHY5_9VIBR|nr:hypothetical protein [Vibrio mytili]KIN11014.1 hypothetical protein SU60_09605 [Vibrio mytili]
MSTHNRTGFVIKWRKGLAVTAHILLDTGETACKIEKSLREGVNDKRYEVMGQRPDNCHVCKTCLNALGLPENSMPPQSSLLPE